MHVTDGITQMNPAGPVQIPAGETVLPEPGGNHIMLMMLTGALEEGASSPPTLA